MKNSDKVAILMCTYNGEKYIKEQIDSILNQTYQNFVLYIRDDNSTDNTKEIISYYVKKYNGKIIEVVDNKIAHSASKNFMFLLEYVYKLDIFDIFVFSDQDDYWEKDKIKVTVDEYNKIKSKDIPILIHTDLTVVDSKLNTINPSFMKYSNLSAKRNKFINYLIQNNVTGCTMLINRSLVDLIKFDIEYIRMHDWYFALIASAFGKVIFIDKPMVKYRQHNNNVLGAKNNKGIRWIYNLLKNYKTTLKSIVELFKQAESFKKSYFNVLSNKNQKILNNFIKFKIITKNWNN